MRKNWIAVASAQHARWGCEKPDSGYMQVGHGKLAPLKRVAPGDRVAYYSRTITFGAKDNFQRFVSIGVVQEGVPYAFDMGGGFVPYRRDVAYLTAQEVSILPLLDQFEFVEDRQRWGYKFRFGLFEVNDHDMRLIAQAMLADLGRLALAA
ncbi:EVE domain-containing protein [Polaromonas sp.]|uniref:EVE domain-containing protein n=1 Tax=Polaromonas sp. TaxID=1869339 RepID=UPI003264FFA1